MTEVTGIDHIYIDDSDIDRSEIFYSLSIFCEAHREIAGMAYQVGTHSIFLLTKRVYALHARLRCVQ